MLDDPIEVFRAVMDRAPAADRAVMADPQRQAEFAVASKEALRQGVDGWVDEAFALHSPWDDVDLAAVATSVTWWHAPRTPTLRCRPHDVWSASCQTRG